MKEIFTLVALSILLISCAAKLPYAGDYPMTREIFQSHDGIIIGRIPQGWFASAEDSLVPALEAWLIKDDFSATLALRELNLDGAVSRRVEKEGLQLLARISAGFYPADRGSDGIDLQQFSFEGRKYCGYETGSGAERRRIIVFTARGRFYEFEARAENGNGTAAEIAHLFTIQQSVLSSFSF